MSKRSKPVDDKAVDLIQEKNINELKTLSSLLSMENFDKIREDLTTEFNNVVDNIKKFIDERF